MARICSGAMAAFLVCGCSGDTGQPVDTGHVAPSETSAVPTSAGTVTGTVSVRTLVLHVAMEWPVGWPPQVQRALETLPGVANVTVDYDAQTATCTVASDDFSADKAIEALAAAGYSDAGLAEALWTANVQDLRAEREFLVRNTRFLWLRRTKQPRWATLKPNQFRTFGMAFVQCLLVANREKQLAVAQFAS